MRFDEPATFVADLFFSVVSVGFELFNLFAQGNVIGKMVSFVDSFFGLSLNLGSYIHICCEMSLLRVCL